MLLCSAAMIAVSGCSGGEVKPALTEAATETPAISTPKSTATTVPTVTPTAAPSSALGVEENSLKGLHVRFWYSGPAGFQTTMDDVLRYFNAGNPQSIWIEGTYFGSFGDLTEQAQAATGEQRPDVALVYPALAAGIQTVDLKAYVEDAVWGMPREEQADYPKGTLSGDSQAIGGIAGYRTGGFLVYNASWASELGFSQPPKTPDEFREQACAAYKANAKVRAAEKNGTGGWIASNDAATVLAWISAFGGKRPALEAQKFSFDDDPTAKAFTFLNGMFADNCAWVARNPEPSGYFANRQALFVSVDSGDLLKLESVMSGQKTPDRWEVIPYPGLDGMQTAFGDGPDYVILAGAPERQLAAWLFIRAITSAENEAKLSQGSGVFPVRSSAREALAGMVDQHPQWGQAYDWVDQLQPMPESAGWVTVRPIFEDAAGQLFQITTKPASIPTILDNLDKTITEVTSHTP
jgi:multiple sugar transport system substrate-binding protein